MTGEEILQHPDKRGQAFVEPEILTPGLKSL
jgi:hypothetical protein